MKDWIKWLLVLAVLVVVGHWLYREGERRERFRLLTWLQGEKMRVDAWIADQKEQRGQQAQLEAGQPMLSGVVLGFQQPAGS